MRSPAILIVEDEVIIAADIANKLGRLGYEVIGLTVTGEESVKLAHRLRPSLVLMDIGLAGTMDGIAAADAIYRECQIPVVLLTAHTGNVTIQRARDVEAFGIINKPFEDRELHMQIEMALNKHTGERRLHVSESRLPVK
jgi:AmiR/NasT family two-component response regulator